MSATNPTSFRTVAGDGYVLVDGISIGTGGTNVKKMAVYTAALSPAAVAANTTAEQTFAVPGLVVGDVVIVNKPTSQAGLGIVGVRASAADQIAITFSNNTAAIITPTAAENYLIAAFGS